jgi:S-DNA-T family DNA segregation ATPase FtsK/SpoIIIE
MVSSRAAAAVPNAAGRGLTKSGHHFLAALPRLDGSSSTDDVTAATKEAVAEIDSFWTGPRAPGVRMLPHRLSRGDLPPPDGDIRVCLGWDEQRLQPVWHDFDRVPHLLVFGDGETGKSNLLRLVARAIVARYQPDQARILLGDPGRELLGIVPPEYRIGYAVDTAALAELSASAAVSMTARLPGAEITPEQLEKRDWWHGPQLFMIIDDYDLFASGGSAGGPIRPLVDVLGQSAHIGLHLVIARSSSGGMRAMMDPLLRRMWELGTPGLLLSYPREEGKFLGEAKPRTLPPGRAQLVTRRDITLIQTGLAGD